MACLPRPDIVSRIESIFIRLHSLPVSLPVYSMETVISPSLVSECGWVYLYGLRILTMVLKERRGSRLEPFLTLIGSENSSDKSRSPNSLEQRC